jgi:TonB family protein
MKSAWIALAALLVACAPRGPDPEIARALADYDEAYQRIVGEMKPKTSLVESETDFRGLTYEQEYAQRVMSPEVLGHLVALREQAANASNVHAANVHLGEARAILSDVSARARKLSWYWVDAMPAPYWRKYWNGMFTANEVPVAPPDPLLLAIESRIREAMDQGDYQRAADEAKTLSEALNRVAGELIEARRSKAIFVARRTSCLPGAPPDPASGKIKIHSQGDPDRFYPSGLKDAGVQSTVVLEMKVDRDGCGRQVAIVVGSGVPELDQAALDWFETARFSPAWQGGGPVASTKLLKFRFKNTGEESHSSRG